MRRKKIVFIILLSVLIMVSGDATAGESMEYRFISDLLDSLHLCKSVLTSRYTADSNLDRLTEDLKSQQSSLRWFQEMVSKYEITDNEAVRKAAANYINGVQDLLTANELMLRASSQLAEQEAHLFLDPQTRERFDLTVRSASRININGLVTILTSSKYLSRMIDAQSNIDYFDSDKQFNITQHERMLLLNKMSELFQEEIHVRRGLIRKAIESNDMTLSRKAAFNDNIIRIHDMLISMNRTRSMVMDSHKMTRQTPREI